MQLGGKWRGLEFPVLQMKVSENSFAWQSVRKHPSSFDCSKKESISKQTFKILRVMLDDCSKE